jgi:ribonuclease BN (tRNA processing enzyme)
MEDANVKVTAAVVNHPPLSPAFAYRFDCPDRSIVISGDTTPSDALIALARDVDVLVHEVMHLASIEKLIAAEPNAKTLREHLLASHTTTEQVGEVAAKARVKTLVLSHFVPGGFPFVRDETWAADVRKHFGGRIVVGKDLLEI